MRPQMSYHNTYFDRNTYTMKLVAVFFITIAAAYWRFAPWEPKVFFADDLANLFAFYDGNFSSNFQQALLKSYVEKYRPIFQLICLFLFSTFDKQLWLYLAFNLFVQGINGTLFFSIASKLAKNKCLVPFFLTLAFATSRFALYQITQVTGPVESVALTFFLIMLYAVLRSLSDPNPSHWQWISLLAITFAVYTHERYIVVLPWLALIFFLSKSNKKSSAPSRYVLILTCLGIVGSNYFIKSSLLHIPFFVGTGGTHMTIDYHMITRHVHEAFFSIFGFNTGPGYLIGTTVSINPYAPGAGLFPWSMATLFSLSFFYVTICSMVFSVIPIRNNLCTLLGAIILICLLFLPPIFTIRVEGRWEYAPFAIVLLIFAWCYGLPKRISNQTIGIVCVVASIALIFLDNAISNSFNANYMIGSARIGEAIRKDIISSLISFKSNELILETPDKTCCDIVTTTRLYELYNKKPNIYCAKTKEDLGNLMDKVPNALVFLFEYKPTDSSFKFIQIPRDNKGP